VVKRGSVAANTKEGLKRNPNEGDDLVAKVVNVKMDDMKANISTKPLTLGRFKKCRMEMAYRSVHRMFSAWGSVGM
jgi:exosome complex RNA-binding protein Rrp4